MKNSCYDNNDVSTAIFIMVSENCTIYVDFSTYSVGDVLILVLVSVPKPELSTLLEKYVQIQQHTYDLYIVYDNLVKFLFVLQWNLWHSVHVIENHLAGCY